MSRLHEEITRVLLGDIVTQRLAPGEWLLREADIAERFGVSRGVARECIRSLEVRGLVAVQHGRGAAVIDEGRWDVLNPEVLAALLESDRGAAVLGEYLEARRILEIAAAGLAAERATRADRAALARAYERMESAACRALHAPAAENRYHVADLAFHRTLIEATGNRALGRMAEAIHRALGAARRPLARPAVRLERGLPEHRRILTAVERGDASEAREAMRDHLLTVESYLREYADVPPARRPGA